MSPRRPLLANADDLEQWSDRYEAAAKLPLLVRRLVLAVHGVTKVSFRTDAGVRLPGWDGFCEGTEPHPYVAAGPAGWEFSVQKDGIAAKATDDFNKRAAEPDAAQITFVYVTSRRWGGKHAWVKDRLAEAKFHSVRVIDADDLDGWLEYTPAVHLWWTRELGKNPDGAIDVETYWNDWSQVTAPPLSTAFIMAGRAQAATSLRQWLESATPSVAVLGPSQEEALAFVAATIQSEAEPRREILSASTAIVSTPESFNDLIGSPSPLLLIPLFDDVVAFKRAVTKGHRLIVPLGGALPGPGRGIPLDRIDPAAGADALIAAGVGRDRAYELARLARRNFPAFRREITPYPTAMVPEWATGGAVTILLPLWMAGGWLEGNESDLEVLRTLSGGDPGALLRQAALWLDTADPPIRREGQFWYFTAKKEGVSLLARFATQQDIERLEEVALRVLGELDPRYTVEKTERWMHLNRPRHSSQMVAGLAETLAAMGGLGQQIRVSALTLTDWSARIVRRLLEAVANDWRLWASLSPQLPLLAEAAPRQFLDAVESGLVDNGPILELFKQEGDGLWGSSPHTGLLWALEGLAWSPDWLPRVTSVIAELARRDPGGRLANRPRESLRGIFLIWYPQNTLQWKDQLSVLESLMRRDSETGWRIVADLLPRSMDSSLPLHKPKFRAWAPEQEPQLTRGEIWRHQYDVVTLLLQHVGVSGSRWSDIIASLGNIPKEAHEAILAGLANLNRDVLPAEDMAKIWNSLRSFVAQHRRFPQADWVLPEQYLRQVEEVEARFEPADPIARTAWLFSHHAHLARDFGEDFETEDAAIQEARLQAVVAVYDDRGIPGIEAMIGVVDEPTILGQSLGASAVGQESDEQLIRQHLASADIRSRDFGRGFVIGRVTSQGDAWIARALQVADLTPAQRAELLVCLPDRTAAWGIAANDPAVDAAYWNIVHPHVRGSVEEVEYVTRKLIEHRRSTAAIELLSRHIKDTVPPSSTLLIDALDAFLDDPKEHALTSNFAYYVGEVLDALAKATDVDQSRLARVEWALAKFLDFHRPPLLLHRELAQSPGFFIDLLSFVFKEEGGEPREVSDADVRRAETAYSVLNSWKTPPGVSSDRTTLDGNTLSGWLDEALDRATAVRRRTMAEQQIGHVLRYAPNGADGVWPHEALRDILEHLKNPQIENGIEIEIYNSRGVVTRDPVGGGGPERQLAAQYAGWAAVLNQRWPRTAELLRRVAEQYDREAQAEDREAELRKDGFW
jgi:hypothetical protein